MADKRALVLLHCLILLALSLDGSANTGPKVTFTVNVAPPHYLGLSVRKILVLDKQGRTSGSDWYCRAIAASIPSALKRTSLTADPIQTATGLLADFEPSNPRAAEMRAQFPADAYAGLTDCDCTIRSDGKCRGTLHIIDGRDGHEILSLMVAGKGDNELWAGEDAANRAASMIAPRAEQIAIALESNVPAEHEAFDAVKQKNYPAARALLEHALAAAPGSDALYFDLGVISEAAADREAARKFYREAVRIAPVKERYKVVLDEFEKRTSDAELLSKGTAVLQPSTSLDQSPAIAASAPLGLIKDQKVILRFSLADLKPKRSFLITYYGGDVTRSEEGSALIDGSAAWTTSVLPHVAEANVVSVKKDQGVVEVQLAVLRARSWRADTFAAPEYDSVDIDPVFKDPPLVILRIAGRDPEVLFNQLVIVRGRAGSEVQQFRQTMRRAAAAKMFSEFLSAIAVERQLALLEAANPDPAEPLKASIAPQTYRQKKYLAVDIGTSKNRYNTRKVDATQRVVEVFQDELFARLKAIGRPLDGATGVNGVSVKCGILFADFGKTAPARTDQLEIYVPIELLAKFVRTEATPQQLLDGSVVIINGTPSQVRL
jgi:hypothetical protein